MKYRVLFDTNVLISASVVAASEDFSISIKHHFAKMSIELLMLANRNIRKRVGITTTFIEEEANFNLEQAVKSELKGISDQREHYFEILSAILNVCENRLREFLSYLRREPIDHNEAKLIFKQVEDMFTSIYLEATSRSLPASTQASMVSRRFMSRKEAYKMYAQQDRQKNAQLINILKKPVEESDITILSQAIFLHRLYKQTEGGDLRFFIASCDYHFSPIIYESGISDQISSRIKTEFDIECKYPDDIYAILKKEL